MTPPPGLRRGDDAPPSASPAKTTVIRHRHGTTLTVPEELGEIAIHCHALGRHLDAVADRPDVFEAPGVRAALAGWALTIARRIRQAA